MYAANQVPIIVPPKNEEPEKKENHESTKKEAKSEPQTIDDIRPYRSKVSESIRVDLNKEVVQMYKFMVETG